MRTIYLDHNATTRPAAEVVDAVAEAMRADWGNPSSVHRFGQQVRARVELARESVARLINAQPAEIVFTSSGTESCNLAIFGVAYRGLSRRAGEQGGQVPSLRPSPAERGEGDGIPASAGMTKGAPTPALPRRAGGGGDIHPLRDVIITTPVEHSAVREAMERLEKEGFTVVRLPVSREGLIAPDDLAAAMRAHENRVALISIIWANNETGVIQPLADLVQIAKAIDRKALLHTDAVQWVGKMPTDAAALGVDLLSFAGHKFHGPKGIGGLFVRRGVRLQAQIVGGPHERERRGGTEDVPGIIGLGVAAELALAKFGSTTSPQRTQRAQREGGEGQEDSPRRSLRAPGVTRGESDRTQSVNLSVSSVSSVVSRLHSTARETAARRDRLEKLILERIPGSVVNGTTDPNRRMWNTTNIAFDRLEAEAILLGLSERGVCASAGAACSSGSLDPSPVLLAMGIEERLAHGSIRFSLAEETTDEEVDAAAEGIVQVVQRLQRVLPVG